MFQMSACMKIIAAYQSKKLHATLKQIALFTVVN